MATELHGSHFYCQYIYILGSSFLRIHRSYIVRTNAVESVMQNSISLYSGTELPVSRGYKDRVAGILADCIYHRKLSNG